MFYYHFEKTISNKWQDCYTINNHMFAISTFLLNDPFHSFMYFWLLQVSPSKILQGATLRSHSTHKQYSYQKCVLGTGHGGQLPVIWVYKVTVLYSTSPKTPMRFLIIPLILFFYYQAAFQNRAIHTAFIFIRLWTVRVSSVHTATNLCRS